MLSNNITNNYTSLFMHFQQKCSLFAKVGDTVVYMEEKLSSLNLMNLGYAPKQVDSLLT